MGAEGHGNRDILRAINLQASREVLAIVGSSGAGKALFFLLPRPP
jgi:ABC-type histidine transport system ATPase subunit